MIRKPGIALLLGWILLLPAVARAQTALATLAGEVRSPQGAPIEAARVFAENEDSGAVTTAVTNAQGQYVVQFLPRGRYNLRVQAVGYRPFDRRDIELHVAQRAVVDVELQPLAPDLAKTLPAIEPGALSRGGIALIYGPDAQAKLGVVDDRPPPQTDATSSTVSTVIDEQRIRELPLNGRDIYTLFVLLPGVTSDNATARGLGFSVNGFPVSSSNYLLDGVDNNDVLSTFPPTLLSPDAIQEYRLATNNFSAEYGRGAFVANVVTRSGGNTWHGGAFEFLLHEKLSANSFQDNSFGRPRPPFKEHQFGYTLGGPLRRDRLFLFTSLEALRANTVGATQTVTLPDPSLASRASGSVAADLLKRFQPLPLSGMTNVDANRIRGQIAPHVSINTLAASGRVDYDLRPDRDRVFVRFGSFDQTFDNVVANTFSPYRGLSAPLVTAARNIAAGHVHRFRASLVNEAKFGFSRNSHELLPQAKGVPELASNDGARLPGNVASNSEQRYRDDVVHVIENLSLLLARHHLVTGGEYRPVFDDSLFAPNRIGRFVFANVLDFAADRAQALSTTVDRFSTDRYRQPDYTRHYRQNEFAGFLQDNWRVSRRLTLNLGARYEYFGVPRNTQGGQDATFYFGSGGNPFERVASGALRQTSEAGGALRNVLYAPDRNNIAPRLGFAFDLFGNSRTVLRGGYGIYYDRLFNLLSDAVRLNNQVLMTFFRSDGFRYASPGSAALPDGPARVPADTVNAVDSGLRTPYVQTWFAGVQHALSRNTLVEVSQAGSLGRKLAARDIVNRTPNNAAYKEIRLTANQGNSSFLALETSVQRRFSRGLQFQVSHTWSHAIDNQGDPLIAPQNLEPAFQQEFNASGDRGNADFDQRHNLVFSVLWQVPRARGSGWVGALLSGWQLAGITGYRTGFPFSVIARGRAFAAEAGPLINARADSLGGPVEPPGEPAVNGGRLLLDRVRFSDPFRAASSARLGNTGRNAFRGPGFWNYDLSVSREFRTRFPAETGRLQFRAEFFNAFNHANLGNPSANLNSQSFGVAQYGRRGFSSLAVGTSALNEFPRRVQLVLKYVF